MRSWRKRWSVPNGRSFSAALLHLVAVKPGFILNEEVTNRRIYNHASENLTDWLNLIFAVAVYLFLVSLGLRCWARACFRFGEHNLVCQRSAWASHCCGFSRCAALGIWDSVMVVCGLVPWHAESSPTRDRTHVPCVARQWTTREVPIWAYLMALKHKPGE